MEPVGGTPCPARGGGDPRLSNETERDGVVVAVLACQPCDEVAYSAVVPRRPDLAQACPGCGARMAVSDLIVGE